jgi:tetratricopeptide (TPR) repeat protein
MATPAQRAARLALDQVRPAFDRLARATDPSETADTLIEAWTGAEHALRELAGSSTLSGQSLVRELRSRGMLALNEAHALVDFQAASDRARQADYRVTATDITAARDGYDRIVELIERDGDPPPKVAAAPPPVVTDATATPGPSAVSGARSNLLGRVIIAVAVLAIVGTGTYFALTRSREPADLRRGRAAFAAGDRLGAKAAFASAMTRHPELAEPHVYIGRMAREEGDLATANVALRRAVELEPSNPITHRELAALLLATNQLELARSFYERAIRLDPNDRNALGFMGCTLARMGRFDLAPRFLQRAGEGSWQLCASQAMQPAPPPAP